MISSYLLEAKGVLIVTPSQLVRNSIAIHFRELTALEQRKVTPSGMDKPNVPEQKETITSLQDWKGLKAFNVVVATPQSISPAIETIPSTPDD